MKGVIAIEGILVVIAAPTETPSIVAVTEFPAALIDTTSLCQPVVAAIAVFRVVQTPALPHSKNQFPLFNPFE